MKKISYYQYHPQKPGYKPLHKWWKAGLQIHVLPACAVLIAFEFSGSIHTHFFAEAPGVPVLPGVIFFLSDYPGKIAG